MILSLQEKEKGLVFSETKVQKRCLKLSVSRIVQVSRQVNQ